jgi:hypothetical protein
MAEIQELCVNLRNKVKGLKQEMDNLQTQHMQDKFENIKFKNQTDAIFVRI